MIRAQAAASARDDDGECAMEISSKSKGNINRRSVVRLISSSFFFWFFDFFLHFPPSWFVRHSSGSATVRWRQGKPKNVTLAAQKNITHRSRMTEVRGGAVVVLANSQSAKLCSVREKKNF